MGYLKPSFLYPAASAYQLAKGTIHRFNHGLLVMYFASEGADMIVASIMGYGAYGNFEHQFALNACGWFWTKVA